MARSAEKAMTALARWRAVYVDKIQDTKKRPYLVSDCAILKDAMFFRRQIVHEITRKIAQIQNPSLGEYKLRDLNDEVNKLIREKDHWDARILDLGGPDFKADAPKFFEKDGKEVPGNRGYRYFGAARDLPGVRELFEDQPKPPPRKSRGELMKCVDISYYGNCDEDDGVIIPQEAAYEEEYMDRRANAWIRQHEEDTQAMWKRKLKSSQEQDDDEEENPDEQNIYDTGDNPADTELLKMYSEVSRGAQLEKNIESEITVHASLAMALSNVEEDEKEVSIEQLMAKTSRSLGKKGSLKRPFAALSTLPTQKQIEEALVERRKRELLEQYMTPEFLESVSATGKLLGVEKEAPLKTDMELIEVEEDSEESAAEDDQKQDQEMTETRTEDDQ